MSESEIPPDREGFARQHGADLYAAALDLTGDPHEAEDLVQETFLRALESYHQFEGDSAVSTWLYRIAVNTYLNEERRHDAEREADRDRPHSLPEQKASSSPEDGARRSTRHERIQEALQVLTARERTAVVLRHWNGKSTEATAEIMGVAEGTVKSLLYRGLNKLREELSPIRDQLG